MIVIRANPVNMSQQPLVWLLPVEYLPPTQHLDLITLKELRKYWPLPHDTLIIQFFVLPTIVKHSHQAARKKNACRSRHSLL